MIFVADATDASLINPAALTRQIKKVRTIQALLHTYCHYASYVNNVHLSVCWTSLGRLAGRPAQRFCQQKRVGELEPLELEPLVHHTVQATKVGELDARSLANIAYGAACSVRDKKLFAALARSAEAQRHMTDFTPQELANPAWRSAKATTAGQKNASLFAALATAAQRCIGDFNP